jgi:hypothetical protein
VIRNFNPPEQTTILQTKLRDLELAQLRVAPQLAVLTAEYRLALASYLGQDKPTGPVFHGNKRALVPPKASSSDTLKKLDALDAKRRTIEVTIKPDVLRP